jgi:hypothetical protein
MSGTQRTVEERRRIRRLLLDLVLLCCGISGLVTLWKLGQGHGTWQLVFGAAVVWQLFWYTLRVVVMVFIWRRERAISPGRKIWIGLAMPIWGLLGILIGHGALSAWLEAERSAGRGRRGDETGAADGAAEAGCREGGAAG